MRSHSRMTIHVAFGHYVFNAHYHTDAYLTVDVSSDLCTDPTDDQYLMGFNATIVRHAIEHELAKTLCGRLLVWEQELDAYHADSSCDIQEGYVLPYSKLTVWTHRPTIEIVAVRLAVMIRDSLAGLGRPDLIVEGFEFAEGPILSTTFDREAFVEAVELGEKLFPNLPSATQRSCRLT